MLNIAVFCRSLVVRFCISDDYYNILVYFCYTNTRICSTVLLHAHIFTSCVSVPVCAQYNRKRVYVCIKMKMCLDTDVVAAVAASFVPTNVLQVEMYKFSKWKHTSPVAAFNH